MVAAGRLAGLAHAGAASQPGSDRGRADEQEEIPPLDRHPDTLPPRTAQTVIIRTGRGVCPPQVQRLAGLPVVWAAGQHATELAAGRDTELGEDLAQVVLDG